MGRHHVKGGLECLVTDQVSRLEQWSNHPIAEKDSSRLHQFGPKVMLGIFLGYVLHVGGIWKGDKEFHVRRLNSKERLMKGYFFKFPVADGTVKVSGGDQRLGTSTLIRDRPEQGEEQEVLRGETNGLSTPITLEADSTLDAEGKMILGLLREISSIAIRGNPESNCTCREKNDFLFFSSTSTLPEIHIIICVDKFHKIHFIDRKAI